MDSTPLSGLATERAAELVRLSYETNPTFTRPVERLPSRFTDWGLRAILSEHVLLSGTGTRKWNRLTVFESATTPIRGSKSAGRIFSGSKGTRIEEYAEHLAATGI